MTSRQLRNKNLMPLEDACKIIDEEEEKEDNHAKKNSKNLQEEKMNKTLKEMGIFEPSLSFEEKEDILKSLDESVNSAKQDELRRKNSQIEVEINIREPSEQIDQIQAITERDINIKHPEASESLSTSLSEKDAAQTAIESTPEKIRKTSHDDADGKVTSSDDEDIFSTNKKRHTTESKCNDNLKRLKTDELVAGKSKIIYKLVDVKYHTLRSVDSVVKALQRNLEEWKQANNLFKQPVIWSKPIVPRASNDVIPGNYIPDCLLNKYKKLLTSQNRAHPLLSQEKVKIVPELNINDNIEVDVETVPEGTRTKRAAATAALRGFNVDSSPEPEDDDSEGWLQSQSKSTSKKNKGRGKKVQSKKVTPQLTTSANTKSREVDGHTLGDFIQKQTSNNSSNAHSLRSSSRRHNQQSPKPTIPKDTAAKCPVCSQMFTVETIENHAADCASNTFAD